MNRPLETVSIDQPQAVHAFVGGCQTGIGHMVKGKGDPMMAADDIADFDGNL
jgi:hypothetical protein